MTHQTPYNQGFVALLSTIIITLVLMIVMFSTSMSTFFARFDALGDENYAVSSSLAMGCVNVALAKIVTDYEYTGSEVINIDPSKTCKINAVTYSPSDPNTPITQSKLATITTSAEFPSINGSWSTTTVKVIITNKNSITSPSQASPIKIVSWN